MGRKVVIEPITRLEGHGKIDIFLNDEGGVDRAYLQVPELRGFETFAQGRPAEDMPQITSRICGVCPTAHHVAATKALDDLYQVDPPSPAKKIRELVYNTFVLEDHALHLYFLGGPDFIVGPQAPKEQRNILGVLGKVGTDVGRKVILARKSCRDLITRIAGKVIHPVFGLPGGVAKSLTLEDRQKAVKVADGAVEFALFSLRVFEDLVLSNAKYMEWITSDTYTHKTHYMGLVDENNRLNFYEGRLRVVKPDGAELVKFPVQEYLNHIAEHVEPWSYVKFCFLKDKGWSGFKEGADSGIYCVGPLARLNVSDRMATPEAQKAFEKFCETFGGKPVHHTLATHWARVIEMIYAAERMKELANDPEIGDAHVRTLPTKTPSEGFGLVEAPRGTLVHHYKTDARGIVTMANLVVATQNNSGRISMSVDKAAKGLIRNNEVNDGLLNMVEMAFRAYDPCHGCATHALPGQMPLILRIYNSNHQLQREIRRNGS